MHALDWIIVATYIACVLAICFAAAVRQKNQDDYFLASRGMSAWKIAVSILATQVSTISLIGAPAFIALRGGMKWLQYELALPLAMACMIVFLVPLYYRARITSIYEVLEHRFGTSARLAVTVTFLASRGLATGAALYATSVVLFACLGFSLTATIVLMGVFTLLYTAVGGIKADIYSDIVQFVILVAGISAAVVVGWGLIGGWEGFLLGLRSRPVQILDFRHHGLGDGETFSFWPMFVGGFFLYVSYYGCDQSQAQRLLTAGAVGTPQRALLINGLARFPMTLLYCFFGLILAVYLTQYPAERMALDSGNIDILVPRFILHHMPHGVIGLIMSAFFAAGMSSMDSALNSLSAATMKDFVEPALCRRGKTSPGTLLRASRAVTVLWGILAILTAVWLCGSRRTVLETVNMIGSVFYGPVLGVFAFGFLSRKKARAPVLWGLLAGILTTVCVWSFCDKVSWMWWNLTGFVGTLFFSWLSGYLQGLETARNVQPQNMRIALATLPRSPGTYKYALLLLAYTAAIIALCVTLQQKYI